MQLSADFVKIEYKSACFRGLADRESKYLSVVLERAAGRVTNVDYVPAAVGLLHSPEIISVAHRLVCESELTSGGHYKEIAVLVAEREVLIFIEKEGKEQRTFRQFACQAVISGRNRNTFQATDSY